MLEKSLGILFYLKKRNHKIDYSLPLYLRITVDGKQKEFALKRNWDQKKWDQKSGRAVGLKEETKALNHYLDVMRNKVYAARSYLIDRGQTITASAIHDIVTGNHQRKWQLLDLFAQHNGDLRNLVGKGIAKGTLTNFDVTLAHVRTFLQSEYKCNDINILSLDLNFVKKFYQWLRANKSCSHNTSIKNIANLKKIILNCVDSGWLINDPFAKFIMRRTDVIPVFLTSDEIQIIVTKKISTARLDRVRDLFLFCCFTGLAFIDLKQLRKAEVTTGIDGKLWIIKDRQKSKIRSTIPLLPPAIKIIKKYRNDPECLANDRLLPVLSNQKYNAYLKELGDICGLSKTLKSHVARHTFGTTITLGNHVPIETVSKMMGHTNLRQTQHYAKVLPLKISQDMAALHSKLENLSELKE